VIETHIRHHQTDGLILSLLPHRTLYKFSTGELLTSCTGSSITVLYHMTRDCQIQFTAIINILVITSSQRTPPAAAAVWPGDGGSVGDVHGRSRCCFTLPHTQRHHLMTCYTNDVLHRTISSVNSAVNPLTPTVAIWVQL